jgi:hypothetical protein
VPDDETCNVRIYSLVLVDMTAVNTEDSREDCDINKEEKRSNRNQSPFRRNRRNAYLVNRSPSQQPLYKLTPRYPILEQRQALPFSKTLRSTTCGQLLSLDNGWFDSEGVIFFDLMLVAEGLSCMGVEAPQGDILEFVDSNACIYVLRLHLRDRDSQAYPTSHL